MPLSRDRQAGIPENPPLLQCRGRDQTWVQQVHSDKHRSACPLSLVSCIGDAYPSPLFRIAGLGLLGIRGLVF